jgi:tRNA pseudouridine55 synthase
MVARLFFGSCISISFAVMFVLPTREELISGGVLLIDKPYKWTSFDAIHKIKIALRAKIGHCGTLDPLATGLLICCTGIMTKSISDYQRLPKEYTGTITLGAVTPTYDLESEPMEFKDVPSFGLDDILAATGPFTGDILQTPPIHSAIKVAGKRSYDLARSGKDVQLEARPVHIAEFEITGFELPNVQFRVLCSTGTYIRSLANDFGTALGCGGYLSALRRTMIGSFKVDDALTPGDWVARWKEPVV